MSRLLRATPLAAIPGVALDCETTGLDPRKARIIEVAACHLDGDRLDTLNAFQSLVSSGAPVPESSTRVHGLTEQMLSGAPDFRTLWPGIRSFTAGRVMIGHTIAFDLAILAAECERASEPFEPPLALDVRFLAQVIEPRLPGYSLDALAAWLEITIGNRHRALGDAEAAARIFARLVPRLRERNIRTVGEAMTATARLAEQAQPSAYALSGQQPARDVLEKLDSYPYRHRVRDVMSTPPAFCAPETPLHDAIRSMIDRRLSSLLVGEAGGVADDTGILTERDALRAVATGGAAALAMPAAAIASRPLQAVREEAFIYRAIGRMSRLNFRHLAVIDEDRTVTGMVSARDLLRLRAGTAIALGDEIAEAGDVATLGRVWARLPAMAAALLDEGLDARTIAAVIAGELSALTARATGLAVERMARDGKGGPPQPYAMLVLGSAGRGESLLAMDQDNALIFADGGEDGPADRWFAEMAAHANLLLDAVGVPLCKGRVMAREAPFRGSAAGWRERIGRWFSRTNPDDLLAVDIFLDFRSVAGDSRLALDLWRDATAAARGSNALLKLLARASEGDSHAVGFLGRLRTDEDGRIDLKKTGLRRIVPAARVLALAHGVDARGTGERLAGLVAGGHGARADLLRLDEAHRIILDRILRQQVADIQAGHQPTNRVDPRLGGSAAQDELKEALGHLSAVDGMVRDALH
jgi:DNA polymerase-3 subunit epsilon/CBS domain-containing protein